MWFVYRSCDEIQSDKPRSFPWCLSNWNVLKDDFSEYPVSDNFLPRLNVVSGQDAEVAKLESGHS